MRIGKKYFRLICIVLTLIMVFSSFTIGSHASNESQNSIPGNDKKIQMADIESHWGNKVITKWLSNNLILGYPDGTFKPNGKITKAEFITLINRVYGFYETTKDNYGDVKSKNWYYNAAGIAKANSYMDWYDKDALSPNSYITRQEVCAIISSIYYLDLSKTSIDENTYKDAKDIPQWSKAYVGAAMEKGYLKGYGDKTIKPQGEITRAEALTILDRAVGNLINNEGTYGSKENNQEIEGNLTINSKNVVLRNTVIKGDLILAAGIKEGDVDLEKITVEGKVVVNGGGENSIVFNNSEMDEIIISKVNGKIRVVSKNSEIGKAILKSEGKLEGSFKNSNVKILSRGEKVELEGDFSEVDVASKVKINITEDTVIDVLKLNEKNTQVDIGKQAKVKEIIFNQPTKVTGQGTIIKAVINSEGVTAEQKVGEKVLLKDGIDTSGINEKSSSSSSGGSSHSSGGSSHSSSSNDSIAPTVAFDPANGTSNVKIDKPITITFNKAVRKLNDSVLENNDLTSMITLKETDKNGKDVVFSATIDDDKKVITIYPNPGTFEYLKYNQQYYVAIASQLEDEADNAITATNTVFTTADGPVAVITPENGAKDIALDTKIKISFNTPIRQYDNSPLENDDLGMILFQTSGTAVAFTATIDSEKKIITITPNENLKYNQSYIVTMPRSVEDYNDNSNKATSATFTTVAKTTELSGSGTIDDPFIVNSIEDLILVGSGSNSDGNEYSLSAYYKLKRDLDFKDEESYESGSVDSNLISVSGVTHTGFTPIGNNSSSSFTGYFDGDNHTISNLYINKESFDVNYVGLFGYVSGGEIKNLGMIAGDVTSKGYNTNAIAGILAGGNTWGATITNCFVTGTSSAIRTGTDSGGRSYAGGLIGFCGGTIDNCYSIVNVEASAGTKEAYAGGLTASADNNSIISNCYSKGDVSASGGSIRIGGIASYNYGNISKCYSICDLHAEAVYNLYAGGLVGTNDDGLSDSIAFNNIIAVSAGANSYVGRVAGENRSEGTLNNNYANADMTGGGGVININDNGGADMPAFQFGDVNSYDSSGTDPDLNWDFDDIWQMGTDRPILQNVGNDNGDMHYSYLINNGFEDEEIDLIPSGWKNVYSSQPVIVSSTVSKNGNNSLKLDGSSGGASVCYKQIDISGLSHLIFEANLYPTSEYENGTMELSDNYNYRKLRLTVLNGKIQYSTSGHDNNDLVELTDYTLNTWYNVKLAVNLTSETYDIYVNGVLEASDISMINMDKPLNAAGMSSGNASGSNTIYFDDVKVYGY
ncbi:S-layer homology domain-containing protein [Anaerovorax odorimutans]|uniref:S-layer homology domain-containing protein n=1 Tax=Anaerovorax odorimutans TaxID=109327 RepID=UPI00040546E9|nr:S-layer homology domain-containing protein [Anaerovorax odorimutans]